MAAADLLSTQDTESASLELKRVIIGYRDVQLLKSVDLVVHPGEIVGITGPSGCGKSMLLHCVAGLSDPIHGKVLLDGASPTTFGWPGFRRRVLLAFQQPVLFEETVQEALERPFHYRVSNFPFPRERARELLNRLGIESTRFDQPALSLSIGQQQRVCLVRALLLNPDYLLLDEPTSALDDESVVAVEALLKERAVSDQLGIVMVTHARKQVDRMCDRSLSLDKHVVTQ